MIRILVLIGASVLAGSAGGASPQLIDGVAAIVNDRVITYSEVQRYVLPVYNNLRRDFAGPQDDGGTWGDALQLLDGTEVRFPAQAADNHVRLIQMRLT